MFTSQRSTTKSIREPMMILLPKRRLKEVRLVPQPKKQLPMKTEEMPKLLPMLKLLVTPL